MNEDKVIEGYWHLPGNESPESVVYGQLNFSTKTGLRLDLKKSLCGIELFFGNDEIDLDFIHGVTMEGKKITLYKCIIIKSTTGGIPTEKYYAHFAFTGNHHFKKREELMFKGIEVNLQDMEIWNGNPCLYHSLETFEDQNFRKFIFSNNPKVISEYELIEDYKLILTDISTYHYNSGLRNIHLDKKTYTEITSEKPKDFVLFLEKIGHLNNFLNLSLGYYIHTESIILYYDSSDKPDDHCELLYESIHSIKSDHNLDQHSKYPFTKNEICNFQDVIKRWYQLESKLNYSILTAVELIYSPNSINEVNFLEMARSIENLANNFLEENSLMSPSEYEKITKPLLGHVDSKHIEMFKEMFEAGNRKSLSVKINHILKKIPRSVLKQMLGKQKASKISYKLAEIRNDKTHVANRNRFSVNDHYALLQSILEILILNFVGIEEPLLKKYLDIRYPHGFEKKH